MRSVLALSITMSSNVGWSIIAYTDPRLWSRFERAQYTHTELEGVHVSTYSNVLSTSVNEATSLRS
jgi:hypothetical protein